MQMLLKIALSVAQFAADRVTIEHENISTCVDMTRIDVGLWLDGKAVEFDGQPWEASTGSH